MGSDGPRDGQAEAGVKGGYTDETVGNRVNNLPFEVIPKPFPMAHLVARVQAALNHAG